MSEEYLNTTNKELLIRIDERVNQMQRDIKFLKQTTIPSSEHLQLMKSMTDHEARIDGLEHFKTRIIAYLGLAATVGGIVAGLIVDVIKNQFFNS